MWLRLKSSGTAEYVADLGRALAMIDDGSAEAIDALPPRPEVAAEPEPSEKAHRAPKPKGRK
jgi:hypothetical protein